MAAITSAIIAGVTAAYSIGSSEDAKGKALKKQHEGRQKNAALEKEAKDREETEDKRSAAVDERSKRLKRQKSIAAEKQGRAGTILAGGEGGGAAASTSLGAGAGKSLLGA